MKKIITTVGCQMLAAGILLVIPSCSRPTVDSKAEKFNKDAESLITGIQQYKELTVFYP